MEVEAFWRIGVGITKERSGGGLAVEAGAGLDFAGLGGAIGEFDGDTSADGGGVAGRTAQADGEGVAAGRTVIEEGEGRAVVAGDKKIGPAVLIEIEHDEGLGVTGHDQTALGRRHAGKMSLAVAAEQLA